MRIIIGCVYIWCAVSMRKAATHVTPDAVRQATAPPPPPPVATTPGLPLRGIFGDMSSGGRDAAAEERPGS